MQGQGQERPSSAILLERQGRFFFYQPGLGVIASGESVGAAYERFAGARSSYLAEAERAGLTTVPPTAATGSFVGPTGTTVARPDMLRQLALFGIKTVIVLAIIGVVAQVVANSIGGAIDRASQALARLEPISIQDVGDKTAEIVRDFKQLPENRRDAFLQNIGILSRTLEPYVEAWRNPPPLEPSRK